MNPEPKPYRSGQWTVSGIVVGSFLGLIFGKLALGAIFGFFIGVLADARRRKSNSVTRDAAPIEKDSSAE